MVDRPQQDRNLGLPSVVVAGRKYTRYDPGVALDIIEKIAEGELLRDICDPKAEHPTVSRDTFLRWVATVPELAPAYAAAQRISALSFEEEAISDARRVARAPGSPQNVSAAVAKMKQLQWSAERRDPTKYSAKGDTKIVVPITINSSLNLGSAPGKAEAEIPDMYNLKIVEGEFNEVPDEEGEIENKEQLKEMLDLSPVTSAERQPFLQAQRKPNLGRPGHGPRKRVLTPRIKKETE